jgi:hypothetical protein
VPAAAITAVPSSKKTFAPPEIASEVNTVATRFA